MLSEGTEPVLSAALIFDLLVHCQENFMSGLIFSALALDDM